MVVVVAQPGLQVGVDVVDVFVVPVAERGAVVLVQAGALEAFDEGVPAVALRRNRRVSTSLVHVVGVALHDVLAERDVAQSHALPSGPRCADRTEVVSRTPRRRDWSKSLGAHGRPAKSWKATTAPWLTCRPVVGRGSYLRMTRPDQQSRMTIV